MIRTLETLSLAAFVSAIYAAALLPCFAVLRLLLCGWADPWAWATLTLLLLLATTPLTWTDSTGPRSLMTYICRSACNYFPITVKMEDEDALKPSGSYVFGYEPHNALPVGIPGVFSTPSPGLPRFLQGGKFHALASGVCFRVPLVRQLWWWLGLRPATREVIQDILGSGGSVMLCPGGVQECLYMSAEDELVFLKKRKGFVKMAIQHGSALVPVFAFGQGASYTWCRPGPPLVPQTVVEWISRKIGAVPLLIYGRWMTPIPHQAPFTIVIGKPIQVPHQASPSEELVEQLLGRFIQEMQALFDKHKAACGFPNRELRVM